MLELRGIVPRHDRPPPDGGPDGFSLVGRDGVRRTTRFARARSRARGGDGALVFDLDLEPRGAIDVTLDFEVSGARRRRARRRDPAAPATRRARASARTTSSSTASSSARSTTSSCSAPSSTASSYYAAGLPWFATLFGRDSLITAFETLLVRARRRGGHAAAARGAARHARCDDERDEEPGKVLHELRVGEPATLGETPVRPLLRQRRRHAAVPVPARRARRLVRQPRPVPRAARAGGGRARVDRPLRRPRRRRPGRVQAPLRARARRRRAGRTRPTASRTTPASRSRRPSRSWRCRATWRAPSA